MRFYLYDQLCQDHSQSWSLRVDRNPLIPWEIKLDLRTPECREKGTASRSAHERKSRESKSVVRSVRLVCAG